MGAKMASETKGHELVPAQVFIPARPVPDDEWVARRLRGRRRHSQAGQSIDVRGVETGATSIAEAEQLSRVVLRRLECAIHDGDRTALWKMLRDRPELILISNVCDVVSRWITNGSLRAPRGRPKGASTWSPMVVAGLVDHLIARGVARTREQACSSLDALGLSYEQAKRLCAQASKEPRFRALLVVDEERAMSAGERELQWIRGAEPLSTGKTISRTIVEPQLGGTVDVKFQAAK
jgi:hypothetical protein